MIGIFDSGFGGLTVMKEYLKKYPDFDYVYLGDQANAPYGPHSRERVEALTLKNIDYLVKQGCKLIIVACNTASADALRVVQQKYKGKPVILGVIVPAVEAAFKQSRFGNIGVIGTRGVIKSGAYERELAKYGVLYAPTDKRARKEVKVYSQACPLLVPLIEEGILSHPATRMILRNYLRPLKNANIDTLILGCTHYPLLQKEIARMMGKNCIVISSAKAAVDAIEPYFKAHPDLLKKISKKGGRQYLTTDCPERFAEIGGRFLGEKIEVEKVDI
ncbi:glutamate racemase [Patescibacteria group bacterium]|nr:glutamate racemase [Patescibacteria group bacterium]MBU1016021.1 glutamate racemase [Patescibacteria group bacterium]MBU1684981.1 glutamate racemase [Patescibacteria group bacterium]MBU1938877.1 glutamate racemase [Patescibacteria group bacterium]